MAEGMIRTHADGTAARGFALASLRLTRALGQEAADAHALVAYVHGRPVGDIRQEMGGVTTTLALLAEHVGMALPGPDVPPDFRSRNAAWMRDVFLGDPTDTLERVSRHAEECLELGQSIGQTPSEAHALVAEAHAGEAPDPVRAMADAVDAVASLGRDLGVDAWACGEEELARISTPAMRERIRDKRGRRHGRGALPGWVEEAPPSNRVTRPGNRRQEPDPASPKAAQVAGERLTR